MDIPEPEGIAETDRWRAQVAQKTTGTAKKPHVLTKFTYTIIHEDGSCTLRTVTHDGSLEAAPTIEEQKLPRAPDEDGAAKATKKPPIGAPRDLPAGAHWTAKRRVFADDKNDVKTTITYTVTRVDGKHYVQTEEQTNDGPVSIAKGPLIDDDDDAEHDDDDDDDLESTTTKPVAPTAEARDDDDPDVHPEPPPVKEEEPPLEKPGDDAPPPPPPEASTKETPAALEETEPKEDTTPPPPPPVDESEATGQLESKAEPDQPEEQPETGEPETKESPEETEPEKEEPEEPEPEAKAEPEEPTKAAAEPEEKAAKAAEPEEKPAKPAAAPPPPSDPQSKPPEKPKKKIAPPRGLPEAASWVAKREAVRRGSSATVKTTYQITTPTVTYTQVETVVDDGEPTIEKGPEKAVDDDAKAKAASAAKKPIPPPRGLPEGAGWKARRSTVKDEAGAVIVTTTYEVTTRDGRGYTQKEIVTGDDPNAEPTVEKGPERDVGPGPSAKVAAKPIGPPQGLPDGAGWKAKRQTTQDASGKTTHVTTYTVTTRDRITHVLSEYTQKETVVDDGEIAVEKSKPKKVGY